MAPGRLTFDGDTPVERVAISGATLAVLMQAVNSSQGDCDGILFGHVKRHTTSNIVDDDTGPQTSQELTASVTGHYCAGRVTSFYDATGRIDPSKLAQMMGERESRGGDAPLGWFVCRRGSTMRPSMRETTVTANLRTTPFYLSQDSLEGSKDLRDRNGKGTCEDLSESRSPKTQTVDGCADASMTGNPDTAISPMRDGGALASREILSAGETPSLQGDFATTKSSRSARGNALNPNTSTTAPQEGTNSKLIGIPAASPCIFFLFTESSDSNSIHTHEYRAFQYRMKLSGAGCFEPRSVSIVNIGPAFRGLYDSFAPTAPFPWFLQSSDLGDESSDEGLRRLGDRRDASTMDVQMKAPQGAEQALLDMYSQDFSVDRLQSLIRTEGEGGSVGELEALYRTMLRKLEVLAKQVCEGNDAIAEQELANAKLRNALQSARKG